MYNQAENELITVQEPSEPKHSQDFYTWGQG